MKQGMFDFVRKYSKYNAIFTRKLIIIKRVIDADLHLEMKVSSQTSFVSFTRIRSKLMNVKFDVKGLRHK